MALHCLICKRLAADRTAAKSPWPFCSERCRLIDLGKWLGEEYRVADGPEGSAGFAADPTGDDPDRS